MQTARPTSIPSDFSDAAVASILGDGPEGQRSLLKQMREVERFVNRRRGELAAVDQRIFELRKSTLTPSL